ncbi:MAG: DNA alkylation repair protein [Methanobacteriota archaeon]
MVELKAILNELRASANPRNVEGMARYGINPKNNYGNSISSLRKMSSEIGKDHELAMLLWDSGIHDARLLATLVGEPEKMTEEQAEIMVGGIDSWDVCDAFCMWLMRYTPFAYRKATEWSESEMEFERRAAFSLIASLAILDKNAPDSKFASLLPLIERASSDERNYVKKAVNWALRGIGKRNLALNKAAIAAAKRILAIDAKSSRWIARDALRELEGEKVRAMLEKKAQRLAKSRSRARRA